MAGLTCLHGVPFTEHCRHCMSFNAFVTGEAEELEAPSLVVKESPNNE